MKKVLLSITCIALVAMTAKAQDPEMRMGVKAGMNYTSVSVSVDEGDAGDSPNGIGWHAGLYFEKNFSDLIGLRPELVLSSRATQTDVEVLGTTIETTNTPLYLEIPVLLNLTISPNFSVHVGPEFDLMLSNTVKVDGEKSDEASTTDGLNTFQMGAALGVFYELEMGLNFGARYVRDFTTINASEDNDGGLKMNNGVFQLSVGYSIKKS